jgi:hypothetical protein
MRLCKDRVMPNTQNSRSSACLSPPAVSQPTSRYVAGLRRAGIGAGEVRVSRLTASRATEPRTGRDPAGGPRAGQATVFAAHAHDRPLVHRWGV